MQNNYSADFYQSSFRGPRTFSEVREVLRVHGIHLVLLGLQGSKLMEAPKNQRLTVPKTGSKIDQKYKDGHAFFMCVAVQKSKENGKRSKILNSQVS